VVFVHRKSNLIFGLLKDKIRSVQESTFIQYNAGKIWRCTVCKTFAT